jgi:hypothetical protein
VAAFLAGTGITVLAVLTITGEVVWSDGAGEPIHNIFVRIGLGLFYGVWGLGTVGGAIFGFPEVPHSRRPRSRRAGGDIGIDFD